MCRNDLCKKCNNLTTALLSFVLWLQGINFQQFLAFSRLLRSISELDTALSFHTLAGAAIDTATFLHMAKVVANAELNPHVVDVVFTLFDFTVSECCLVAGF